MKEEISLIKTCVGLVSEDTVRCLTFKAVEIAISVDIPLEEALTIILKLCSKGVEECWESSKGMYLDFMYDCDYVVVNKMLDDTEIACLYNDNYNVIYSLKNKKFYIEYPTSEYGDELIKEEINI